MSGTEDNKFEGLEKQAAAIKMLMDLASMKLDALIEAIKDPTILHKEFSGRKRGIEDKLDTVLKALIEIEKLQKEK